MPSEPERRSNRNERVAKVGTTHTAAEEDTNATQHPAPIKISKPTTIKILFLAANPRDTDPLKLEHEIEVIKEKVRETEFGNLFEIQKHSGVRADQLHDFLLDYKPDIVHFSGHASSASELVLENSLGQSQRVSRKAIANLFALLPRNIRFVVLNACYTESQAEAIAEHIEWVVGMSKEITDASAIEFAGSFYRALGYGYSVRNAFELSCNHLALTGLGEQATPKLKGSNTNANVFPSSNEVVRSLLSRSDNKRLQTAQQLTLVPQKHLTLLLIHRSQEDSNTSVRYWLNRALGKIGSARAIEALRRNRDDPEPFARLGAEDALKECRPE
jgi:hypothetical protein